jgi:hypothetical protein
VQLQRPIHHPFLIVDHLMLSLLLHRCHLMLPMLLLHLNFLNNNTCINNVLIY